MTLRTTSVLFLAMACAPATTTPDVSEPRPADPVIEDPGTDDPVDPPVRRLAAVPTVTDIAVEAGVQDGGQPTFQRGRACIAADFDLDGLTDLYVGNPGDRSFVMRNTGVVDGKPVFERGWPLLEDQLAWAASAADYDNDGDPDIFITNGGNEGRGFDRLFKNMWVETGAYDFNEVSESAQMMGKWNPVTRQPIPTPSANAAWADFDMDGDLDAFVSGSYFQRDSREHEDGHNFLWRNAGDGTFRDVSDELGLGASLERTRHSTWLDVDNDGDMDLYESNYLGPNVLWRNELMETGEARFTNITPQMEALGAKIGTEAWGSFASASADFNNDGWEDLFVFTRAATAGDCSDPGTDADRTQLEGHHLLLNLGPDRGFVDVGDLSGVNAYRYYRTDVVMGGQGVMGCQIGDMDGNGLLEVFIGNGGPGTGERNHLFSTTELREVQIEGAGTVLVPIFADWTSLIDFEAPHDPAITRPYPEYPYRTHGSCMVDFDNDGLLELYVTNGGPKALPDAVREPDRLFDFALPAESRPDVLFVRLKGDGRTIARDPVGGRVAVTVRDQDGVVRTLHRTLFAGSAFSAQNGFDLYFGLGFAEAIERVEVRWPNGESQLVEGVEMNTRIEVTYAP